MTLRKIRNAGAENSDLRSGVRISGNSIITSGNNTQNDHNCDALKAAV
ncbi:hypothetical protein YPPY66_4010 [Yersinia pestis PY-66]|nr:hypothetical protein YpUG050454_1085 [Yersinia pestis biovar Antiqua str. UG05-0454]EDR67291.1 hypothetical protein YpK1973002_2418 [Yersinia pestis biovar Mediaevalis str. K1973002]EIS68972.1 hypothetical protein YPPY66_4010 [Yersinia pestis PY-66]EIS91952.1 hypothetical protein YPPY89_3939 [Yersinia pestis PY-89]